MNEEPFQILLVEDNPADVYLFRMALTDAQFNFHLNVIEDGALAMDYIQKHGQDPESQVPDLAVLDLNLPKIEGLIVLEALRKSQRLARVPVVVTTSSSTDVERSKSQHLGVEKFLTKPPDLQGFLELGTILKDILVENRIKNGSLPHGRGSELTGPRP